MEHYYSEQQSSPLKIRKIMQRIKGVEFIFNTSSGVFSKNSVDTGTLILAESMSMEKKSKVLDIGCGIGVLGICAARLFDADVSMSDINKRCVMLARMNAKINDVKAEFFQGSLYEPVKKYDFDVVLSNPPQNTGKKLCFEIIEGSRGYLKENGTLQLVARHNKGGKSLSEKMKEIFGNVKVIAKKAGYWVYVSVKE